MRICDREGLRRALVSFLISGSILGDLWRSQEDLRNTNSLHF
jgi:hypothetical protein